MRSDAPVAVRVLGKSFTITAVPGLRDREGAYGTCDGAAQDIKYDPEPHREQVADTLLHEVVHAVDEAMGTSMSERQVRGIATGLLGVFKDNPAFLKFITT